MNFLDNTFLIKQGAKPLKNNRMKFTVDTDAKRITLIGSFKFEDLGRLRAILPSEWWGYTIEMETVKEYVYYPFFYPYNNPEPYRITYGSPLTWSGDIFCSSTTRIDPNVPSTFTNNSQTPLNFGPDSELN